MKAVFSCALLAVASALPWEDSQYFMSTWSAADNLVAGPVHKYDIIQDTGLYQSELLLKDQYSHYGDMVSHMAAGTPNAGASEYRYPRMVWSAVKGWMRTQPSWYDGSYGQMKEFCKAFNIWDGTTDINGDHVTGTSTFEATTSTDVQAKVATKSHFCRSCFGDDDAQFCRSCFGDDVAVDVKSRFCRGCFGDDDAQFCRSCFGDDDAQVKSRFCRGCFGDDDAQVRASFCRSCFGDDDPQVKTNFCRSCFGDDDAQFCRSCFGDDDAQVKTRFCRSCFGDDDAQTTAAFCRSCFGDDDAQTKTRFCRSCFGDDDAQVKASFCRSCFGDDDPEVHSAFCRSCFGDDVEAQTKCQCNGKNATLSSAQRTKLEQYKKDGKYNVLGFAAAEGLDPDECECAIKKDRNLEIRVYGSKRIREYKQFDYAGHEVRFNGANSL